MKQQTKGAEKLIQDRGGVNYVAGVLGWPYSTVHTYHRLDQAPDYRWKIIAALPLRAAPVRGEAARKAA